MRSLFIHLFFISVYLNVGLVFGYAWHSNNGGKNIFKKGIFFDVRATEESIEKMRGLANRAKKELIFLEKYSALVRMFYLDCTNRVSILFNNGIFFDEEEYLDSVCVTKIAISSFYETCMNSMSNIIRHKEYQKIGTTLFIGVCVGAVAMYH